MIDQEDVMRECRALMDWRQTEPDETTFCKAYSFGYLALCYSAYDLLDMFSDPNRYKDMFFESFSDVAADSFWETEVESLDDVRTRIEECLNAYDHLVEWKGKTLETQQK